MVVIRCLLPIQSPSKISRVHAESNNIHWFDFVIRGCSHNVFTDHYITTWFCSFIIRSELPHFFVREIELPPKYTFLNLLNFIWVGRVLDFLAQYWYGCGHKPYGTTDVIFVPLSAYGQFLGGFLMGTGIYHSAISFIRVINLPISMPLDSPQPPSKSVLQLWFVWISYMAAFWVVRGVHGTDPYVSTIVRIGAHR